MSIFDKFKRNKINIANSWTCQKCKTDNSLTTNVCIKCHSRNNDIKVVSVDKHDSILYNKKPSINSFEKKTVKCSECGNIYESSSSFCHNCGAKARSIVKPKLDSSLLSKNEQIAYQKSEKHKMQLKSKCNSVEQNLIHLHGLPIPEKSKCEIWECEEKLIIYYGSFFLLDYSKIMKIDIFTHSDIEKHYVNNASGAIVGAMLLGPIGALIGGGTKEITNYKNTSFFSITYNSNDEIKYIVFDISSSFASVSKFAEKIRKKVNLKNNSVFEL